MHQGLCVLSVGSVAIARNPGFGMGPLAIAGDKPDRLAWSHPQFWTESWTSSIFTLAYGQSHPNRRRLVDDVRATFGTCLRLDLGGRFLRP